MMRIIIDGQPVPKMRARHTLRGKFAITYDPQSAKKKQVAQQMKLSLMHYKLNDREQYEETYQSKALVVFLTFYFLPPKSSNVNRLLWNFEHHIKKPDIDNLAKFYLDCGNDVLWEDDYVITNLYARKLYSETPQTEIFIMPKSTFEIGDEWIKVLECFSPNEMQSFLKDAKKIGNLLESEILLDNPGTSLEAVSKSIAEFCITYDEKIKKVSKKVKDGKLCQTIPNL